MFERIALKLTASNLAYNSHPDFIRERIVNDMRMRIADKVANLGVTEHRNEYSTDFRCELIVCNDEDFYRAVQEEARKLAYGMTPTPVWVDESHPVQGTA